MPISDTSVQSTPTSMGSYEYDISAATVMKRVTMAVSIRVTGLSLLRIRVWFACQLLSLAARIAGCGIEVTTKIDGDEEDADQFL